jgi:hypothetical protein
MSDTCEHGRVNGAFCPHCVISDSYSGTIPVELDELTEDDQKIVVQAANETATALREIIEKAKAGDKGALKKLEAFEKYSDPQLAARVALMNNKQRRAFEASRRGKNKSGARG